MANFRKSFNLRNGVQVDDDNFIVNANGLVGIGTSVPTEFLDVRGNTRVVGVVTANSIFSPSVTVSGVATITQLKAGIITAFNGITTYYGDGRFLLGLPTSQWVDIDVGLGFTSIYAQGFVGVSTNDPRFALQIGGNPSNSQSGVGINSSGNIVATGIVTASSFVGSGANVTSINANNIDSGTLNNSRLPSNISISGVVTATGGFVGNVTGIASTALSLSGSPSITVTNITASNYNSSGILTTGTINGQSATVTTINSGFSTSGITTIHTRLEIASLGSIGIGTNNPNADIHVRDANNGASLQLTSDGNNEAYVAIGRSVARNGNNSEIRFGNTDGSYLYSTSSSLDVINYGIGNVNNYLQLGAAGVGTGSFNWIYGQAYNTPIMTLTYGGRLGIGVTNPINTLHVVGTSTVTGNSYIGANSEISGNLNVGGTLTASNFSSTTMTGSFIGPLSGNVNSTGISTFSGGIIVSGLSTAGSLNITNIGIGTTSNSTNPLQVNSGGQTFLVNSLGGIGVGTDKFAFAPSLIYNVTVDASQGVGYFRGVGVGTTTPSCFADFSAAGYNVPALGNIFQYMLPPKVTTTVRNSLSVVEGAFIYNTTNKRLEIYNGSGWSGIATIP